MQFIVYIIYNIFDLVNTLQLQNKTYCKYQNGIEWKYLFNIVVVKLLFL